MYFLTAQLQYQSSSGWSNCSQAGLSASCALVAGYNLIRVLIPDTVNATTLTAGYLTITNGMSTKQNCSCCAWLSTYSY